jgi:hypothetical protein
MSMYLRPLTRNDHGLNEISNVAQNNTEALHTTTLTPFGIHRLDLHTLQHWILHRAAARLEDGSAVVLAGSLQHLAGSAYRIAP